MSESKHTPGPWVASGQSVSAPESQGVSVGWCGTAGASGPDGSYYISREEAEANAALIARAPELLAERDAFVRELDPETGNVVTAMANLLALRKRLDKAEAMLKATAYVLGSPKDADRLPEALSHVLQGYRQRAEKAEAELARWRERYNTLWNSDALADVRKLAAELDALRATSAELDADRLRKHERAFKLAADLDAALRCLAKCGCTYRMGETMQRVQQLLADREAKRG